MVSMYPCNRAMLKKSISQRKQLRLLGHFVSRIPSSKKGEIQADINDLDIYQWMDGWKLMSLGFCQTMCGVRKDKSFNRFEDLKR